MNLLGLALRMLWGRAFVVTLTALSVALGLGLVSATLAMSTAAQRAAREVSTRYPLIIGPKIGAVPLVLGALTSLQQLEGGMDARMLERLSSDDRVRKAVPILSGHAASGFALVGTSAHYFEPRVRFPLAGGRLFEPTAREVVIGNDLARILGKAPGDELELEHRHSGADYTPQRLRIVGVLESRGDEMDRTAFCPVEAIHESHKHISSANGAAHIEVAKDAHAHEDGAAHIEHEGKAHDRLSAILIVPRDEPSLLSLQEELSARDDVDVALSAQTMRRIADQLAAPGDLVRMLAWGVTLVTLLSLACGVYVIAIQGSREIAALRLLGARRLDGAIVSGLMGLGLIVVALGGALLVALGLSHIAQQALRQQMGLDATVTVLSSGTAALFAFVGAVLLGMMLWPALGVYRMAPLEAQLAVPGSHGVRRLKRAVRSLVFTVLVIVVMLQLTIQTGPTNAVVPLDPASAAVFEELSRWQGGDDPAAIASRNGTPLTLMGYMYVVGEPFESERFYLVGQDPRLAHCPFCYRAPTRRERILVVSPGKPREITKGPVRVTGVLHIALESTDPVTLDLAQFEVVIDQKTPQQSHQKHRP